MSCVRGFDLGLQSFGSLKVQTGFDFLACSLDCFGVMTLCCCRELLKEQYCVMVAMMLEEAAEEFQLRQRDGEIRVVCGDAIDEIRVQGSADVIFLDPMFPDRGRQSAQPRKAQQMLRRLAGEDPDASILFQVARQHARKRVVVKRPRNAPPLGDDPDIMHKGKSVRYDIYLTGRTSR